MTNPTFTRAPGLYDRIGTEMSEAASITARLQAVLASFGYQTVETPLVEYADLFLTKSGDDAVKRLFHFELRGRHLCLRSEFTPAAVRLYVERFQHKPKPIRWQFAGPVFRYESPQRSHSRQFTMLGTELIGMPGVFGDAETIGMATQGLYKIGLHEWTLVIGHIGLISQILDCFGLERRIKRFLLGQIENLRRTDRGRGYVEQEVQKLYLGAAEAAKLDGLTEGGSIDPALMNKTLTLLLDSANLVMPGGGRSPEEIARRLLTKQRYAAQHDRVASALDLLEKLIAIEETPQVAIPMLESLLGDLPDSDAALATLQSLKQTLDLLTAYNIDPAQIRVMPGMARGLNYYTGIVFEIHTLAGDSSSQLCGGGRYDDFIRVLGASQDTPAVGFAYGLQRILQELSRLGYQHETRALPSAAIIPIAEADMAEAIRVATQLRESFTAELVQPPANHNQLVQLLNRFGEGEKDYVIVLGENERGTGMISLRDMKTGEQTRCTVAQAMDVINRNAKGNS
ncbi:MAG: histidine--tRNA ligase family protein [Anaerolineae bacterium]|nr:histidine--tRNA ligase family protein [Anaerolineae bacterium]